MPVTSPMIAWEGWAYLATVTGLSSGHVVGRP
jgi:hypothetical protein